MPDPIPPASAWCDSEFGRSAESKRREINERVFHFTIIVEIDLVSNLDKELIVQSVFTSKCFGTVLNYDNHKNLDLISKQLQ